MELQQLILKCGGLPKVTVAIADLLAPQTLGWTRSTSSMNMSFMQNLEVMPEFACLRGLFGWMRSYFRVCLDLLRPCIFYLSIFPGYHSIRRRRLVMRWVAEGYSKDSDSYTAEENGEMLFSKLVEMSMVQPPPQEIITHMRMVLCHVSGFFHEYIISRPKDENIVFALEVFALKKLCRPTTQRTGRHLVIEESWQRDKIVFQRIDFSRLRSLTMFGEWEPFIVSKGMKVLRVLDLENASGVTDKDLQQMVKLLPRLKFLSLRGSSQIFHLPSSLGDLRQLETLDVRHTSIEILPASITKLKKLQYIRAGTTSPVPPSSVSWFPNCCKPHRFLGVEVTRGTQKLTALHTFGVVNIDIKRGKAILKDIGKLTHLRKLGVSGISKSNSNVFFSSISGKPRLESLSVWLSGSNQEYFDGISELPENLQSLKLYGLIKKVPKWIKQLPRLTKLDLEITIPEEVDISSVLGCLKELCIIRLRVKPLQNCRINFCVMISGVEERSFENVKILEIVCCSRILDVNFGSEAMRKLELIKAGCCAGSQLQFAELKNLSKLKEVKVISSHDDTLKNHLEARLTEHPSRPSLKMEEVVVSTEQQAGQNNSFCCYGNM